jgi:hypothetical protein
MKYKHLSQAERYQIYALMKVGLDQTQIAKLLDRHKSTISRELIRNIGSRGYRPKQACKFSAERAQNSRNAPTVEPWVREEASSLVRMQWSPEQIAARLPIGYLRQLSHVVDDVGDVVGAKLVVVVAVIFFSSIAYEVVVEVVEVDLTDGDVDVGFVVVVVIVVL